MCNPMNNAKRKKVIVSLLHRFHKNPHVSVLYKVTFLDENDKPDVEMSMRVAEPKMNFLKSMWEEAGLEVITNE